MLAGTHFQSTVIKTWMNVYKLVDISPPAPLMERTNSLSFTHQKGPPFVSTLNKSISFYISPPSPSPYTIKTVDNIILPPTNSLQRSPPSEVPPPPHAGHIPVRLLTLIAVLFDYE